jgi:hypothetical protein
MSSVANASVSEEWDVDRHLGSVDARVDLARMDVYRQLIQAKSENDFYVESVLNAFIAVAQQSLNFAFYNKSGKLMFHLVSDLKYNDTFTKEIDKSLWFEKSVSFFPSLFEEEGFRILVMRMHTKTAVEKDLFTAVSFENSWRDDKINKSSQEEIGSLERYLQRCVYRFFFDTWDGFRTPLRFQFAEAIKNSIHTREKTFRSNIREGHSEAKEWPPDGKQIVENLRSTRLPNSEPEDWHNALRYRFNSMVRDSGFGLEVQYNLLHRQTTKSRPGHPNMIIAYRSFTRDAGNLRHEIAEGTGYPYDTRFLFPDELGTEQAEGTVRFTTEFFSRLKEDFSTDPFKYDATSGGKPRTRRLYRNLFEQSFSGDTIPYALRKESKEDQVKAYKNLCAITARLDEEFWKLLCQEDGVAKCVKILGAPAGKNFRSVVDPVYHSGLIHTNMLFELGGLDRLQGSGKAVELITEEQFEENMTDLLRVVIFYYLFSDMANRNGDNIDFDPRRLAAILVPIRMKGAVWAVTIHAAYVPKDRQSNDGTLEFSSFMDVPYWIAYYHISTSLREKNNQLIDRVLWEGVQRRVSRLLEKHLGSVTSPDKFIEAIETVNDKMRGEERLVPYVLPNFITEVENSDGLGSLDDRRDKQLIIPSHGNKKFVLPWEINRKNPFFVSAQTWDGKGTRNFVSAVESGFGKGLTMWASNTSKKSTP